MAEPITGTEAATLYSELRREAASVAEQDRAAWKPFDAAVWLLDRRWSCVDGWSVVSTPDEWAGTLLLNGEHYRVTIELAEAGEQRG